MWGNYIWFAPIIALSFQDRKFKVLKTLFVFCFFLQIHLYTSQTAELMYASISIIKAQLSKTLKLELMMPSSNWTQVGSNEH